MTDSNGRTWPAQPTLPGFDDINENLDLLRGGDIVGRAVIKY
ncbi:MAG: hypothetical protein WD066_00720 [Planctomycetaceae bacterium]